MKVPQYNLGRALGASYNLWQVATSYVNLPNFIIGFFNLWALWELKIKNLIPWMTLPIFLFIAVFLIVCIAVFHYVFVQAAVIAFQNEQAYKHVNPVASDLEKLLADSKKIKEKLGIEE